MRTLISAACLLTTLLNMPALAQRVSQTAPRANPNLTAQGRQRPPVSHPEPAGSVEGFVYWDAKQFSHLPAGSCSGLAVTVSVKNSSSSGPFPTYTTLGTLSNNFKYVGQVKAFLAGGKIEVYDVCTYGYDHVPVGPDLQVKLTVTQPGVFSPVALPKVGILEPIQIINAQCAMLPRIVNPTFSDLAAHWGSCQNMAFDVNFMMVAPPQPPLAKSGGGGMLPASGNVPGEKAPGTTGTPLLKNPAPTGTPLLKQSGPIGTPSLVNPGPIQSSSTSAPGATVNAGSTGGPMNGTKPGTTAQLNPQPLPPKVTGALTPPASNKPITASGRFSLGPKITISGARPQGIDVAIAQTIQSESLATHNVRAAMLSGTQPERNSNLRAGPSRPLDSTDPAAGGSTGQSGTGPSGGNNPVHPAGTPSTQAGGSGSPSTIQRFLVAPKPLDVCRFTTDPVVETVGGRINNIILTPDPGTGQYPNNQYAIVGCNFGDVQGDVHIFGPFINNPTPVHLGIDSWTDSSILVTFNPTFENEYDLKNITLVVVRRDGKSAQVPGISFVATRASRPLASIPGSIVKLPTGSFERNKFVSPISAANLKAAGIPQPQGLPPGPQAGTIAFYLSTPLSDSRTDDGYPPSRLSFSDAIDFSKLRQGFVLDDSAQTLVLGFPYLYSDTFGAGTCKYTDTVLSPSLQGSTLLVGVQPEECDSHGKFIYAYYGLILSVTGPKGNKLDPWPNGLQ